MTGANGRTAGGQAEERGNVGHTGPKDLDFYPDSDGGWAMVEFRQRSNRIESVIWEDHTDYRIGERLEGVKAGKETDTVVQATTTDEALT